MNKLTDERLMEIMHDDSIETDWEGDNAIQGLNIIAKYINPIEKSIIVGAVHDMILSVDLNTIIEAGLTEEDAILLRTLNWMEEYDALACFV